MIHTNSESAFTMIETLIVVAIIGVLSGFAYSSYSEFKTESKRQEATSSLVQAQIKIESYMRLKNVKIDDVLTQANTLGNFKSEHENYEISTVTHSGKGGYKVTATAIGSHATADPDCRVFTLYADGTKEATNDECW